MYITTIAHTSRGGSWSRWRGLLFLEHLLHHYYNNSSYTRLYFQDANITKYWIKIQSFNPFNQNVNIIYAYKEGEINTFYIKIINVTTQTHRKGCCTIIQQFICVLFQSYKSKHSENIILHTIFMSPHPSWPPVHTPIRGVDGRSGWDSIWHKVF